MSLTTRINGINAKVFWIDAIGTVDLSADRRNLDVTREVMTFDAQAGNDMAAAKKATLYHYAATLTMFSTGTAGTASMNRIKEGSEGTLVWGKEGTATGKGKDGFPALVVSHNDPVPYPDGQEITVTFEGQGALAFDSRAGAAW